MSRAELSDFERHGLAGDKLSITAGRLWLLTIDFEAFRPETIDWWARAMRSWAASARRTGLRFSFFVSIEDVVRLRLASDPGIFETFASACRELETAGSRFYPHNHCLFDPETGHRPGEASGFPTRVDGYPRFPSLVYDVRYRNATSVASWLPTVVDEHLEFLEAAGLTHNDVMAFRAGGWDYGVSIEDMRDFIDGVERSGCAYDSSALCGAVDRPPATSRLPYGRNAFQLRPQLVEVAPTDHVNCGLLPSIGRWSAKLVRRQALGSTARPGVLVTVIHFDHLFHSGHGRGTRYFTTTDGRSVDRRIERFFRALVAVRRVLALKSCTFDGLPWTGASGGDDVVSRAPVTTRPLPEPPRPRAPSS